MTDIPLKRKAKGLIEVTSFAFLSSPPKNGVMKLSDCKMPLKHPVPGCFSALHGHRNKLDAMQIAREYANEKKLILIAVNLYLQVEHPIVPGVTFPETIKDRSFISMARISRTLAIEVADHWKKRMVEDFGYSKDAIELLYDWTRPEDFISNCPQYIAELLEEWKTSVIAHHSKFSFSDREISVATFKPTQSLLTAIEVDPGSTKYVQKIVNDLF
ncbi:MAG: hypothetical protein Q7K26_02050 [bacterium]|nr:hypothetical protein [bacterium]